jgi:hypothetical protein
MLESIRSTIGSGNQHIFYARTECECAPPRSQGEFLLVEFQELW